MKWIVVLIITAIVVGIGIWAYGSFGSTTVVVASPDRREAIRAVYATGSVRAEQIARLRPEVGGEVLQVAVQQGGEIRQGELVMELEVTEEEDAVIEQQSRVREQQVLVRDAKDAYDRESALLEQGATTQEAVDRAKAAYDRAMAGLRTLQSTLTSRRSRIDKGRIMAPITGVVTSVNVSVGDVIPANWDAVTILDPASFKVYAEIDELDISRIRPGQPAIVAFDAMPKQRYSARVERIVPMADEVTKTIPVILNLIDYVPGLSDGLTATVNVIEERRPNALTIPSNALFDESSDNAVIFVVTDNNRLQRREVKLGVRGEEYVEIVEGLGESERVALDPQPSWQAGQEVEIDKARMRQLAE